VVNSQQKESKQEQNQQKGVTDAESQRRNSIDNGKDGVKSPNRPLSRQKSETH